MIGFSAPWMLAIAGAAAVVVGALHLLSVQRPTLLVLPTARFVPVGEARAVARQPRPDDLLLLLLRVVMLLLVGLAAAGISWRSRTPTRARVVVADARFRADSATWLAPLLARDRAAATTTVQWSASLNDEPGAALVLAAREAQRIVDEDESVGDVALLVATPRTARSWQGYAAWRRVWPGAMTVVLRDADVAASISSDEARGDVRVRARDAEDVVAAALGAFAPPRDDPRDDVPGVTVRVDRDGSTDLDRGGAIAVRWPVTGVPDGWQALERPDSIGAVVAGGRALVGAWLRTARYAPMANDSTVHAIAWWSDGSVAAIERAVGTSCTREVGVRVDAGSDLLLAPSAAGLLEAITAPCNARHVSPPVVQRDTLATAATSWPVVDAARLRAGTPARLRPSWLAVMCALAALGVLAAEHVVRSRKVAV